MRINPSGATASLSIKVLLCLLIASTFWAMPAAEPAGNATGDSSQIIFLHLRLKDGQITLLDAGVRPGRLKQPRDGRHSGKLSYELLTSDGQILTTGRFDDPSVRIYEHFDPAQPGSPQRKEVHFPDTEFSLRIARHDLARQVKFYRNPNLYAVQNERPLMGVIDLDILKGGAR